MQEELAAGWALVDSLKTDKVSLERQLKSTKEEAATDKVGLERQLKSAKEEAATDKVGLQRQLKSAKEEAASLRQRVKELEEGRADLLLRAETADKEASSLRRTVDELEDTPTPAAGDAAAPAKIGLAELVTKAQAQARSADDAQEQHSKFSEATFTLAYTGRSTFFGGLESLIGLPTPNLRIAT